MTVYDLLEAITAVDDELLLRSETKQKAYSWAKYAALAACVVLVITAAFIFGRNNANLPIDPDNTDPYVVSDDVTTPTSPEATTNTSGDTSTPSESTAVQDPNIEDITVYQQLNGLEYVLNATWEPDIELPEGVTMNTATGGYYDSYEALCADYSAILKDEITFIRYTVLERISANEAYELTGKKVFENGASTLYKVQLTYDCLNDALLDEVVYLGRHETDEDSQSYRPAYAIGETIVSYISLVNEDKFGYYVPDESLEFAVYEINGLEFAYHIGSEQIEVMSDKYQNLDLEMADSEKLVITSTVYNPVHYTQKSLLSELTAFLDEDWATRRLYFPLDESGSIVETDDAKRYAYVVSMFNGSYDEKQCKFVMDSYWIEALFEILPEEEIYRFRDEVYYNQTLIEQAATPPLYQAVMYFGITREELRAADKYLPEYVLDAIYCGDEAEMKRLLMNEYSLYHDGEVYALYDLIYRPSLRKLIPYEERVEYIEKIKDYLESDDDLYERVYKKFIEEMLDENLSPEVELYNEDENIIFTETKNDHVSEDVTPNGGTYSLSSELEDVLKSEHNAETRFAVKLEVFGISNSYIEEYNEIVSTSDTLRSPDNLTKEQIRVRLSELEQEIPRLEKSLYSASDDKYNDALIDYDNAVFEQTFLNFSLKWHDRILSFEHLELEAKRLKSLGIEVLGVDYDMKDTCEIVAFITEDQLKLLTLDKNVGYKLSMATDELCYSIEKGITVEELYLQGLELACLGKSKNYDSIVNSDTQARYDAAVYEMLYNPRYNWENCHYSGMYAENGYLWIGTGNNVNEDLLLDWISNESISTNGMVSSVYDSREDVKFNHAFKGDFKTLINTFLDICAETDENGERLASRAYINFRANQIVVTVSSEDIADTLRHEHGFTLPYFEVEQS